MNHYIAAVYYNGENATPQHIKVGYYESMAKFYLHTLDRDVVLWEINDIEFEQYQDVIELRNSKFIGALLTIKDQKFSNKFYETMIKNKRVDIHTRLFRLDFLKITGFAVLLLGAIVLSYIYLLPPLAEKSVEILPETVDDEIGNLFLDQYIKEQDVDKIRTLKLQEFANGLKLNNSKPLNFTVINSNEVNAFALPNGHIVVHSAILKGMKTPDELVALLGHEAAHVNHRHSIKMLSRNLAGYFLVSLLFSDVNGAIAILAENAQQIHALSYSRKFEEEADSEGLKILVANKFDPNGIVRLFEQLESNESKYIPQILSSHPLTAKRKQSMKEIINQTPTSYKTNQALNDIFLELKNDLN